MTSVFHQFEAPGITTYRSGGPEEISIGQMLREKSERILQADAALAHHDRLVAAYNELLTSWHHVLLDQQTLDEIVVEMRMIYEAMSREVDWRVAKRVGPPKLRFVGNSFNTSMMCSPSYETGY